MTPSLAQRSGSPPLRRVVLAIVCGAGLGCLLLFAGFRFVRVEGRSMSPALAPGDVAVVAVWPGIGRWVEAGDVVLAEIPTTIPGRTRLAVKRVQRVLTGGEESAYVLRGDRASLSRDSRSFGPVKASALRGEVLAVLPGDAPWRVRGPGPQGASGLSAGSAADGSGASPDGR